jgi:putative membrane protein
MTALSRTIEINLRQMLNEKDLPAPIEPQKGVLM